MLVAESLFCTTLSFTLSRFHFLRRRVTKDWCQLVPFIALRPGCVDADNDSGCTLSVASPHEHAPAHLRLDGKTPRIDVRHAVVAWSLGKVAVLDCY